jgi:hypothetical protein
MFPSVVTLMRDYFRVLLLSVFVFILVTCILSSTLVDLVVQEQLYEASYNVPLLSLLSARAVSYLTCAFQSETHRSCFGIPVHHIYEGFDERYVLP